MTRAADALDTAATVRRTVRLVSHSNALKHALERAFTGYGSSLSLQVSGAPGSEAVAVDVLLLDLAEGASAGRTIAPVVIRLVPRAKWFALDKSERTPGRVFARPEDQDETAMADMASAIVTALRPYRMRRSSQAGSGAGTENRPPAGSSVSGAASRADARSAPETGGTKPQGSAISTLRERAKALSSEAGRSRTETNSSSVTSRTARPDGAARARSSPAPERKRGDTALRPSAAKPKPASAAPKGASAYPPTEVRRSGRFQPRLLVVGSSTGGPQALMTVFRALPHPLGMPVLVVQHMPASFTPMLAEHINSATAWPCREAHDDEIMTPDEARIAPGGFHMELTEAKGGTRLKLHQGPLVNFCRPAVDVLFNSAAHLFGRNTLGIVLTGMGADGAAGSEAIRSAGGMVFVQDEETSVVWGMPGATARAGAADKVLPIGDIAPAIASQVKGGT